MATTNLPLQLRRLAKHYEEAVNTYDEASLLDLSHSLRFWADLRGMLATVAPKALTTIGFKYATPARTLTRRLQPYRYVICLLPGGVVSHAHGGQIMSGGSDLLGNASFSISNKVMRREDGGMEVKEVVLVEGTSEGGKSSDHHEPKRGNFLQWLDSEAVRVNRPEPDGSLAVVRITLEQMIRRVANSLDASHPAGMPTDRPKDPNDALIEALLQTRVVGLSLPFVVLLHAAQQILAIAPKWSGATSSSMA